MDLFGHLDDDDDFMKSSIQNTKPRTEVRRVEFKKDAGHCEKYGIFPRSAKFDDEDDDKTIAPERLVCCKNYILFFIALKADKHGSRNTTTVYSFLLMFRVYTGSLKRISGLLQTHYFRKGKIICG